MQLESRIDARALAMRMFVLVLAVSLTACQGRQDFVGGDASTFGPMGAEGEEGVMAPPAGPVSASPRLATGSLAAPVSSMPIPAAGEFDGMPNPNPVPDEGEGGGDADDYLKKQAEQARIDMERKAFLVKQLLEKAEAALKAGDIDGARDAYGKALNVDGSNQTALEGIRRLSDGRASTTADYANDARGREIVRRQRAAQEVRKFIEEGRSLEARQRFDDAVKKYQKALHVIAWYDETADFGMSAASIRDLIDQTKYKAEVADRAAIEEQAREAMVEQEEKLNAERERRLGRMHAYFEQANVAFRRGDYGLAREYARQILREDPTNADAENMIRISHDAEHYRNQRDWRRRFDDQWRSVMEQIRFDSLPQVEVVEFPDDWLSQIAYSGGGRLSDQEEAEDSDIAGIYATLESRRVSKLVWQDETLSGAVSYLRTITGVNFHITSRVAAEQADNVALTFTLDDVSVKTILDFITEQNEMKWTIEDGIVKIAMPDEVSGRTKLEFFDVKDLNVAISNFMGQEINLTPSNYTPPEPPELPDPAPIFPAENLPDLIKETIGSEQDWGDNRDVTLNNGILVVRNTPEIIRQIGALLDELRANTGILVNLEVRFLTAEDNFLRDVGVDVRGLGDDAQGIGQPGLGTPVVQDDVFFGSPANPFGVPFGVSPEPSSVGTGNDAGIFYNDGQDGSYSARVENLFDVLLGNPEVLTGSGGLTFQHTFLDDTQMEVILRAVEKSERIQQIEAPRITVYNTQRANVQVLNQVSYVADYEVEIAQAAAIANPVVQTILDGIVLDVKPVVSADRRYINLELRPTVATLTRPIATFSTTLAASTANAPVVIQLPELRVSRVRTTVNMPDGGTLLLGGLKFYEQQDYDSGVPFLSKVPILSFLISRQGSYVNRRNLLVLIKATIVNLDELEPKDNLNVPEIPSDRWTPVRQPEPAVAPSRNPCGVPPVGGAKGNEGVAGPRAFR